MKREGNLNVWKASSCTYLYLVGIVVFHKKCSEAFVRFISNITHKNITLAKITMSLFAFDWMKAMPRITNNHPMHGSDSCYYLYSFLFDLFTLVFLRFSNQRWPIVLIALFIIICFNNSIFITLFWVTGTFLILVKSLTSLFELSKR